MALFLLPNEHHEMGLLFTRYILTNYGYNVVYLGSNVPLPALNEIAKNTKKISLYFCCFKLFKTKYFKTESVNIFQIAKLVVANQSLEQA